MQQDVNTGQDVARPGAHAGVDVGAVVGAALGTAAEQMGQQAVRAVDTVVGGYGQVRDRVTATTAGQDAAALVQQWAGVLEDVVEDARDRAAALLAAQPPARRWPWAVGAAVLGAAAGAAVAVAVRRVVGQDAPDAQDPEQLRAVVDTDRTGPTSS